MEHKRPQLNRDELHKLKWLLGGLLVLLSASTILYLDIDAWVLLGLTSGAVLAGLLRPAWPARVPALVHRLAFPAIVAIFLGDLYLNTEVLPALVRLDLLLLLYRGVTYRQRRDDLQVIVLGLFLIVLGGVLTVSLLFAVQILAFVACALVYLLVITLMQAAEDRPEVLAPGVVPGWTRGAWRELGRRVRAALDWRVAALGAALFAGLVVLSALLFMAIPRFELENSLFLERFMTKKARTGFSDQIKFGDVTDIQQDNSVAVSVDVTDPARIPVEPYWRMVVLDEYRDQGFRLSPVLRRMTFSRGRSDVSLRGLARPQFGPPLYWTFYLEAGISRYLPLTGQFEILRFRDRQNFQTAGELGLVALRDDPVSMTAYRVEGMLTTAALRDLAFGAELRQSRAAGTVRRLTQLQLGLEAADRARLGQVVASLTGGAKLNAAEFAARAGEWLARQHPYALQSRTPAGPGDALVRWLTSREPGHCELFAGALVLLAREAGLPARVVTGFKGGTWNGYSNNFTLRNSDAHAWCEIFDEATESWLREDPTPGAGVQPGAENAAPGATGARYVDRSWTARFDSLRIFWYRRIVNFDSRSQMEAFNAVKTATEESGHRLRAWFAELGGRAKAWLAKPWDGRRLMRGLAGVGLAAMLGWLVIRVARGRWRRVWAQRHGRLHPVRAEAGRWLQRLQGRSTDAELRADLQ
ncbi:MAG: transglutaminaseTgpA domain-containing protein, partial [Opitutales bacterium]